MAWHCLDSNFHPIMVDSRGFSWSLAGTFWGNQRDQRHHGWQDSGSHPALATSDDSGTAWHGLEGRVIIGLMQKNGDMNWFVLTVTMENHYFYWVNPCKSTISMGYHGISWLVGGFKHGFYFPFHIWDVILPIDELHHFSRWLLHHQPELVEQGRGKKTNPLDIGIVDVCHHFVLNTHLRDV